MDFSLANQKLENTLPLYLVKSNLTFEFILVIVYFSFIAQIELSALQNLVLPFVATFLKGVE
jgi:hypothetical protein